MALPTAPDSFKEPDKAKAKENKDNLVDASMNVAPKINILGTEDTQAKREFLDVFDERSTKLTKRVEEFNILTNTELGYHSLSTDIGPEEILNFDYEEKFRSLEDKIIKVKEWLQNTLSDRDRTDEIAEARAERGEKMLKMRVLLDKLLLRHYDSSGIVSTAEAGTVSAFVINEILGLGPIEPLWGDPRITEIMVNGPNEVRVEIGGKIIVAKGAKFRDQTHLLDTVNRMLAPLGKTLDIAHPMEDGRLADGSRINATHPVVGPGGPYLTVRRFPETVFSIERLISMGSMSEDIAKEVAFLIHSGCSIIVSGGTGSGKTSMLNALSGCIPLNERIVSIEDNLELRLHSDRHWVAMEARRSVANEGGSSDVTIRKLVKNSLRQRPDRIVVGEVRDSAAYDMLQAMNTGHEGSMTTTHANDPSATITRLSNLVTESKEMDSEQALSLIANSVDIIISIARYEDGSRRLAYVAEVPSTVEGKNLEPSIIWEFQQTGIEEYEDDKGRILERIIGNYVQVNQLSDKIIKRHRLNHKRRFSIEEVYAMSAQEGEVKADFEDKAKALPKAEYTEKVTVDEVIKVAEVDLDDVFDSHDNNEAQQYTELAENINQEAGKSPVSDSLDESGSITGPPIFKSLEGDSI